MMGYSWLTKIVLWAVVWMNDFFFAFTLTLKLS